MAVAAGGVFYGCLYGLQIPPLVSRLENKGPSIDSMNALAMLVGRSFYSVVNDVSTVITSSALASNETTRFTQRHRRRQRRRKRAASLKPFSSVSSAIFIRTKIMASSFKGAVVFPSSVPSSSSGGEGWSDSEITLADIQELGRKEEEGARQSGITWANEW
jgi:hypothetical protein